MRLRSGEHIEGALKRFKKLIERSGIRTEMKRSAYYEKPSERRRRAERKRLKKIHMASAAAGTAVRLPK
ncbi:30S ribosomal protein S21 [bacterium]|jgi:small subunit ribosomal protein S21|nr:30S ribosomal protein S21 [bacterium]